MTEKEEIAYVEGNRAAWRRILSTALRELGYDSPDAKAVSWVTEREAAIQSLRSLCREKGDNDWDENLHFRGHHREAFGLNTCFANPRTYDTMPPCQQGKPLPRRQHVRSPRLKRSPSPLANTYLSKVTYQQTVKMLQQHFLSRAQADVGKLNEKEVASLAKELRLG